MDCHVNMDVTFTVSILMYLYKYISQGPDSTQYTIIHHQMDHMDVIKDLINAHHVSASEASWKVLCLAIPRKFPTVSSLPVHLPGQNSHQMPQRNGSASTAFQLFGYFAHPDIPPLTALEYTNFYTKYLPKCFLQNGLYPGNQWLESSVPHIDVPPLISACIRDDILCRLLSVSSRKCELFNR